jgi:predicted ester cyclase
VESGDVVSVRWSLTATHTRAFLGCPASGETVEVTGTSVFRIEEERIVERWNHEDGLGLMRQLTLLSAQSVKQDPRFQPGYTRTVALAGAI